MNNRFVLFSVAASFSMLSTLAVAQEDPAAILEALDADGNGSLSESEAAANEMIMEQWGELDIDGNAELSAEELAALAK